MIMISGAKLSKKLGDTRIGRAVTRSSLQRKARVPILCQSNWTQCCQWLATVAAFLRNKLCSPGASSKQALPQLK